MKNVLVLSALLLMLQACGGFKDGNNFRVKGKIGDLNAPAKVYLAYQTADGEQVDSMVFKNGQFSFDGKTEGIITGFLVVDYTGDKGQIPSMYSGDYYPFYIEEGIITLNSPDSLKNIAAVNSPINDQAKAYQDAVGGSMKTINAAIQKKFMEAAPEQKADTAFMASLNREYAAAMDSRTKAQEEYIAQNPTSYFSLEALSEIAGVELDLDQIEPKFLALDQKVRDSQLGKAFGRRIEAAKATAIGCVAPDFTQNTPDGQPVSLSDFRGKYLLLDFWASWCGPCRGENPTVVKAYTQYKDKNFEVLGVSLDKEDQKDAWVKAIETDGLTWTNISDLKGWKNAAAEMYGVRGIPQNYLLDPEGRILAKNLRGEALIKYLEELFKARK